MYITFKCMYCGKEIEHNCNPPFLVSSELEEYFKSVAWELSQKCDCRKGEDNE